MPLFKYPIVVIDTENVQEPNTPGWAENLEIGAVLIDASGRKSGMFHEKGPESGARFLEWHAANGKPPVTSYHQSWDKERLVGVGVDGLDWALDLFKVVTAKMRTAGALKRLDNGPKKRTKWPKLEEAMMFYNIPATAAHTIPGDVGMAADLLIAVNREA